jgi:hypothetical protein
MVLIPSSMIYTSSTFRAELFNELKSSLGIIALRLYSLAFFRLHYKMSKNRTISTYITVFTAGSKTILTSVIKMELLPQITLLSLLV